MSAFQGSLLSMFSPYNRMVSTWSIILLLSFKLRLGVALFLLNQIEIVEFKMKRFSESISDCFTTSFKSFLFDWAIKIVQQNIRFRKLIDQFYYFDKVRVLIIGK